MATSKMRLKVFAYIELFNFRSVTMQVLKYDCYPSRGCGYDDDCGMEETCVKESFSPRGYRCLGNVFTTFDPNFRSSAFKS